MLPQDPIMLMSFLNMKLRDQYSSLESLCEDMDENEENILEQMKNAGYTYDAGGNCFR